MNYYIVESTEYYKIYLTKAKNGKEALDKVEEKNTA